MEVANIVLIIIGLIICFGGIYIRKVVSGIMGFIWGITLGITIIMLLAGDTIVYSAMLGSSDSESLLYIMIAFAIAAVVAYISIRFDQLCAAINALLASFILLLVSMLLIFSSEIGALLVILALLVAAVIAYISYLYYMYAFTVITAFSGGLLASLGIEGIVHSSSIIDIILGYSDGITLLAVGTLVLGCAGCVFQIRKLHEMMRNNMIPSTSSSMYDNIDFNRLSSELFEYKSLFIIPIVLFLILSGIEQYFNDSTVIFGIVNTFELCLTGIFLGQLVYLSHVNSIIFNLIYLLPYCAGQILYYHTFENLSYSSIIRLITYILLFLILKIISVLMGDTNAAYIVMTGIAFVWYTWGTALLRDLSGNNLIRINIYYILILVAVIITVWYLYTVHKKGKNQKRFAATVLGLIFVAVAGLSIRYVQDYDLIANELGMDIQPKSTANEDDLEQFITFLDGEWEGSNGNTIIFDVDNGELTVQKDGNTYIYSDNELNFQYDGIDDSWGDAEDPERIYHRWVISPSGTDEFFEVYCDYSYEEMDWIYSIHTSKGDHQNSAENFYKAEDNWSSDVDFEPELDSEQELNLEPEITPEPEPEMESDFEPESSTDRVELIVSEIRSICQETDSELPSMSVEDGGSDTTRYIDENNMIRLIIAKPNAYYDQDAYVSNSTASYFYDTSGQYEHPCFVTITTESGEIHKFYLRDSVCYRYIDGNGTIHDYPDGIDPMEINDYGDFCSKASLEIAWARE